MITTSLPRNMLLVLPFLLVPSSVLQAQFGGGGGGFVGGQAAVELLEFPGGTVAELVSQLQKEEIPNLQFLVTPEASEIHLEAFTLATVTSFTVAQVLPALKPELKIEHINAGVNTIVRISLPRPMVDVQSIGHLIVGKDQKDRSDGHLTLDDVLAAVNTALKFVPSEKPAEIKFHVESGLLIVSGTPIQCSTVAEVVKELNLAANYRSQQAASRRGLRDGNSDGQNLTAEELQRQIQSLTSELANKTHLLREYEKQLNSKLEEARQKEPTTDSD